VRRNIQEGHRQALALRRKAEPLHRERIVEALELRSVGRLISPCAADRGKQGEKCISKLLAHHPNLASTKQYARSWGRVPKSDPAALGRMSREQFHTNAYVVHS